jgi:hypothetical protein
MQLTPKSSFQVFSLLISIYVFSSRTCEGHGLLEIISPQGNSKLGQNLRTGKLGTDRIPSLISRESNLQVGRSLRANVRCDASSGRVSLGRRIWHACHHVWGLTRRLGLRTAACGLFARTMTLSQFPWRRTRRGVLFHLMLRIMATFFPSLPSRSMCTVSSHSLDILLSD